MKNIKLIVSYDGTDFHGWQYQPEIRTVARELKFALELILQETILLKAASRTDAGVHALGQTVHFKTENDIQLSSLIKGVNSILPDDVSVLSMEYMPEDFHSTYESKGKFYRYQILNNQIKDCINRRFHWWFPHFLDVSAMQTASEFMVGEKVEFRGLFINSTNPYKNTIRNISEIKINKNPLTDFFKGESSLPGSYFNKKELLYIDIYGKSFMYKMVRSIVGMLVAVGNRRIKPEDVSKLLSDDPKNRITNVAPAKGLTLMKVYYPK